MKRRTFLKSAAAAVVAAPWVLRAQTKTSAYSTALVGCGWWGINILRCALEAGQAKLVALCDVDQSQLQKAASEAAKLTSDSPKAYGDYREMLAKEKPQIVINATPDHWHALITIDAVKAGAHVYVEKPICHTILEGAAMVKAARDTAKVVQVGTHRRVSPHCISAREFLRSGKAGKIGMVRCFVHYAGGAEQANANSQPPSGLDWDMWCGPAPLRPFNRKIHPKGFRHFLDYANGQLGDWGIHWLDQALWIMEEKHPRTIFSTGGRPIRGPIINDASGQTSDAPDHQVASYQFENFTLTWEHRQFAGNSAEKGENVGCYFYGTEGTFHLAFINGWTFYPADGGKAPMHQDAQLHEPDVQNIKELWADFLDAIQNSRRPVCDIEIGHHSTTCALLGMLSLKQGRSLRWDGQTIVGDAESAALLRRPYRAPWQYPALS